MPSRRDETGLESWQVTLRRQAGDIATILTRGGLRLTGKLLDVTPSGVFVGLLDVHSSPDELAEALGAYGDDAPASWAFVPWPALELITAGSAHAGQAERLAEWRTLLAEHSESGKQSE